MSTLPPQRITRVLEWVCPDYLFEGILADLEEQYYCDLECLGEKAARRRYFWAALQFIRPGILLRNKSNFKIITTTMFSNHLKVGVRSLLRSKLYSFINAFGLSIAIAFGVLIYLFIQDERSFDQMHDHKDRIYRVHTVRQDYEDIGDGRGIRMSAYLQTGLAPTLKSELPEVVASTGINSGVSAIFSINEKTFKEQVTYVHQDFFQMFDFKAVSGDRAQFLKDKSEIVLSASTVEKYFGEQDALGKSIELSIYNVKKLYTIVGIIEDAPKNSSVDYHAGLIRAETREYYEVSLDRWTNWNTPTFVMLESASQFEQFQNSLSDIYDRFVQVEIDKWVEESGYAPTGESHYAALNLLDIHLYPDVSWNRVSDPKYSLVLSGIAILILLIACINYIALSMTSSAGKRLEVGIRKAVGGGRKHLIGQFMTESVLLAVTAMVLSVGLIIFFLPYFNEFTNKSILITDHLVTVMLVLFGLSIALGVLAGSYPSFVLSGFKPIVMLRSRSSTKVKTSVTRPLVILQFAISAFLIICSVVMLRQMEYITTKDLGYNKNQVLVIPTYTGWSDEGEQLVNRFKNGVSDNPHILSISGTSNSFNQGWSRNGYRIDGKVHQAYNYRVDPDYIKTLGIRLKEGRDFDPDNISDRTNTLIVNAALVEDMGWEDPLNEHLDWQEDSLGLGWRIIGVAENYHFKSLEENIEPLLIHLDTASGKITTMLVKIEAENVPETIDYLQAQWKELAGDKPFDYSFLDEDVARQYESYEKWSSIMWLSTLFAILIACLGLFGLSGINTLNRTKEIGIRKALGAELKDILIMMNKPFVIMAVISFVLAIPGAYWAMHEWLSDFQYGIPLGWPLFVISMLTALFLALATVSYHSIKAGLLNPADTLKYE
ncbi:MAG: ABC transporter permease [Bacteroidota bacterium]